MSDDLAKRAVACKGWRWMPGMLTLPFHEDDDRTRAVCHTPWRVTREGVAGPYAHDPTWGALPDLSDPCTLGGLLALVREAWGDPCYLPTCLDADVDKAWVIERPSRDRQTLYESYAAALVAALAAAP